MEAKQSVIVNERTIKGYIELLKSYTEPLSNGKFKELLLKKLLPIMGVGGLIGLVSALAFSAPVITAIMPLVAANLVGMVVVCSEEVKEREKLKEKYPYLDLTLSCEELEEMLKDSGNLVYEDECFYHYHEKTLNKENYIEECNAILEETSKIEYKNMHYKEATNMEIPKVKKLGIIQRTK